MTSTITHNQIDRALIKLFIVFCAFAAGMVLGTGAAEILDLDIDPVISGIIVGGWSALCGHLVLRSVESDSPVKLMNADGVSVQMTLVVSSVQAAQELLAAAQSNDWVLQGA